MRQRTRLLVCGMLTLLVGVCRPGVADEIKPARPDFKDFAGEWVLAEAVHAELGKPKSEFFSTELKFVIDKDPDTRWKKYPDFSFKSATKHLAKTNETTLGSGSLTLQFPSDDEPTEFDVLYTEAKGALHVRLVVVNAGILPVRVIYVPGATKDKSLLFADFPRENGKAGGAIAYKREKSK